MVLPGEGGGLAARLERRGGIHQISPGLVGLCLCLCLCFCLCLCICIYLFLSHSLSLSLSPSPLSLSLSLFLSLSIYLSLAQPRQQTTHGSVTNYESVVPRAMLYTMSVQVRDLVCTGAIRRYRRYRSVDPGPGRRADLAREDATAPIRAAAAR